MIKRITAVVSAAILIGLGIIYLPERIEGTSNSEINSDISFVKNPTIVSKETTQRDRFEYLNKMLRDPEIDQIPRDIYEKEQNFLAEYERSTPQFLKSANNAFSWKEIGPDDVGGRTRALAMDSRNKNILLAGGASGGMWKSTDGGVTWNLKSDIDGHLGVTAVVQDVTNPDKWFYSTGEFFGSAGAEGADFYGSGIFISTDNGESWSQIETTRDSDVQFNSEFDYIVNMAISPTTGSIFYASNAIGIYKSTNDLFSSTYILGDFNNHIWSDVAVNGDGVVIAALSTAFSGVTQTSPPGVFISTNDGTSWINVTPSSYPTTPLRSVIGVSESNPEIFYVFTHSGDDGSVILHRFDITDPNNVITSERTEGIPNFGGSVGDLNPQGGYNLICKVVPNDPNTVLLGGTNLFRSTDGYSTIPPKNNDGFTQSIQGSKYWIGGYSFINNISQYQGHHPDQHNLIFDPDNPVRAISAHDGGISVTENIKATPVIWQDLDEGYNTTQFYTVSIHPDAGDGRIAGGTQDNGTPYFQFNFETPSTNSEDASSGDGAFSYIGKNVAVTSSQNGFLLKFDYSGNDLINFSYLSPLGATNTEFINPFAVNPSNENYLFFVENNHLWRNDQLLTIPRNASNPDGTSAGWTELNSVNAGTASHTISTLSFTTNNPSNRLYYGSSSASLKPSIMRFDDLDANDGEVRTNLDDADFGTHVNSIGVNPDQGDELLAVISNYNAKSIFYSNDGAATFTDIEGNLAGELGPSIRSAAIAPTDDHGTFYFVGTSVGLFYTDQLDGSSTVWTRVAEDVIGNAIVSMLDYRRSDQTLAVGTHGRGLFIGRIGVGVSNELEQISDQASSFRLEQNFPNPFNPSTNIEFSIPSNSTVTLTVFDINGREVAKVHDRQTFSAGSYSSTFDASALSSGTYIYRIEAIPISGGNLFQQTKTMTLIK